MRTRAFTMVELLIVVSILGVLTAVAVPNFQEAQTRSKVSRMNSDMRSLSLAAQSYYVDNGRYPRQGPTSSCAIAFNGVPELTTPIAYVTQYPVDLFHVCEGKQQPIGYGTCSSGSLYYYFWSYGPDQTNQMATLLYDPTNGTVSQGDLKRTTARHPTTIAPE